MTTPTSNICIVGSVNIDTTYRVAHIPALGETILARHKTVAPGGKGANQAVAAATMGSQVVFLGSVGQDAEAQLAKAALARGGVDATQVATIGEVPTGTAILLVDERGENVIVVDAGANQHVDPRRVAAHLSSTDYHVVVSQLEINLTAVLSAARYSDQAIFILNPAPMTADAQGLREVLEHTDVLVPNRFELAQLVGRPVPMDPDALDRCVRQLPFDGAVVVTLGSAGVAVYQPEPARKATYIEPVPVEVVDTTGAGDVFCGVFGHFLALHGDVIRAARQANEFAALSTRVPGAQITTDIFTSSQR